MDSILFLIAQFLTPLVRGLDVVPFQGDCKGYRFDHTVGVFLLKLSPDNRLTVELLFRESGIHVAGDYLELVRKALEKGVSLDESTQIQFAFERNHYLGFNKAEAINYHAATFLLSQATPVETPAEPVAPVEAEEAE